MTQMYAFVDQPTPEVIGQFFTGKQLPLVFTFQPIYGRVLFRNHHIVIRNNVFSWGRR